MSLGRAFLLWIVGFLILTLLLASTLTLQSVRETLVEELLQQGRMMARSIAISVSQGEMPDHVPVAAMQDVRAAEVRDDRDRLLWALGPAVSQVRDLDASLLEIREQVPLPTAAGSRGAPPESIEVVLLISPGRVERQVSALAARLAFGLSVGLGVALIIGLSLIGRVVKPLNLLAAEVRHFHPGTVPALEMPKATTSEISALSEAFSEMAHRLSEQRSALMASEQRFRELFESAPTPLLELDEQIILIGANPSAAPFLWAAPEGPEADARGEGLERYLDELDMERLRQAASVAMRRGAAMVEARWSLDASGPAEVEIHLRRIEGEGPALLLAAVHDQTDRVRRLGERWRRTFGAMVDGVGLVDPTGEIRLANPALEPFATAVAEEVRRRAPARADAQWQGHAGDRALHCALRAPEGLEHLILVVRDVTEAVEAEARLREAQKMAAVATLASGVAHDFNNLLAGILLHTRLILRAADRDEKKETSSSGMDIERSTPEGGVASRTTVVEAASAISDLATQGEEVVREMLLFARQERVRHSRLDLVSLTREQSSVVRHLLPEGVELSLSAAEGSVMVDGSPVALGRVLLNLILNARDAVDPQAGRIEVAVSAAGDPAGPGACREAGDIGRQWAELRVSDNGQGISTEDQERLFEPFFSSRRIGRGAGLGLAVVYAIVAEHGGEIDVSSTPGSGTAVVARLPLVPGAGEGSEGAASAAEPSFDGERVLVVETDGRAAAKLIGGLVEHGLDVRHARTTEEALRVVSRWQAQSVVASASVASYEEIEELVRALRLPVVLLGPGVGGARTSGLGEVGARVEIVDASCAEESMPLVLRKLRVVLASRRSS